MPGKKAKKNEITYIYSEEFKTHSDNPNEKELKKLFNQKFFTTIIKIEKTLSEK